MQKGNKNLKLLYSGPYSEHYGVHLIFNANFERWVKKTNSFIYFVGDYGISHIEELDLFSSLSSANHHCYGFLSDDRYLQELDSVDLGLSLQSPRRLRTNYPSKFFEYSRHQVVCLSSIDMCLPDHLNPLYPKMSHYSTTALIDTLEEVRCNWSSWELNAIQLSKSLSETYHYQRIGLELHSFMMQE